MREQFHSTEEIWMMIKNAIKMGAAVLVLGLASGCASTEGIDSVRSTAESAAREAAAAKTAADAARAAADSAARSAASAQSTADRALSAANAAQASSDANRDRLERMFQKSMSK